MWENETHGATSWWKFSALERTYVVRLGKIAFLSALYLLITSMTSLNTSLRNTGRRRHTPKINSSKSDISPEQLCHSRSRFSKKLMASVGEEKLISFSLIRRKQNLTSTVTLICWRLPYCLNVFDIIQAVTLNSCKTVFRHTVQKWRNSFYDRTLQTS